MAKKRVRRSVDPLTLLLEAAKLVERGELAEARERCARVLEKGPLRTDALELAVVIAERQGQPSQALEFATRALAVAPTTLRLVASARALLALSRVEEANAALDAALAVDPSDASIYEARAAIRVSVGEAAEALDAADGALALGPRRVAAHMARGSALAALDRGDEAAEAFRDAVRASDGDRHVRRAALSALEALLRARGEDAEAEEVAALSRALR